METLKGLTLTNKKKKKYKFSTMELEINLLGFRRVIFLLGFSFWVLLCVGI